MNTELQAMIDAGRKLIAEQATAEQRKTAHAVAEAERLKGIHLAKLPKWMREYVTVTHWDHSVRIYLDLPGCAPIYADSVSWSDGFVQLGVANPLAIQLADFMVLRQREPALGIVLAANVEHQPITIGKERFDDEAVTFACPAEQAAALVQIVRTKYRRDEVRIWRNDTGARSAWRRV